MWIFLNDSFLSVVAHRDRPDDLLVRARRQGDIERVFPEAEVQTTPAADYAFRAVLPREVVGAAVSKAAEEIAYPNFKGSVTEPDRHDAYMSVWGVMRRLQD